MGLYAPSPLALFGFDEIDTDDETFEQDHMTRNGPMIDICMLALLLWMKQYSGVARSPRLRYAALRFAAVSRNAFWDDYLQPWEDSDFYAWEWDELWIKGIIRDHPDYF